MGMKDTAYWLSWFLTYAIIILLAVIIINAITVPAGIFGNSNFFLLVIIFFLYGLSLIHFAFLLTPLFKNSMTAGTVANLSTIIFGVLLIPLNNPGVPNIAKWLACLLSPTAFCLTLTQVIYHSLTSYPFFPFSYSILHSYFLFNFQIILISHSFSHSYFILISKLVSIWKHITHLCCEWYVIVYYIYYDIFHILIITKK